jgi:hypothetical protein
MNTDKVEGEAGKTLELQGRREWKIYECDIPFKEVARWWVKFGTVAGVFLMMIAAAFALMNGLLEYYIMSKSPQVKEATETLLKEIHADPQPNTKR